MNPKTKKALIITGVAVDILITIILFVFSIVLLATMPESTLDIEANTFLGWFQIEPFRILLVDVLPLLVLLAVNFVFTLMYIKKTGKKPEQKQVTLNDLSEEEKSALKQKILQEMMQNSDDAK